MKAFSAAIYAKSGMIEFRRNVLVLAWTEESAREKLGEYIKKDRRLSQADIKGIYLTEEAAVV